MTASLSDESWSQHNQISVDIHHGDEGNALGRVRTSLENSAVIESTVINSSPYQLIFFADGRFGCIFWFGDFDMPKPCLVSKWGDGRQHECFLVSTILSTIIPHSELLTTKMLLITPFPLFCPAFLREYFPSMQHFPSYLSPFEASFSSPYNLRSKEWDASCKKVRDPPKSQTKMVGTSMQIYIGFLAMQIKTVSNPCRTQNRI